MENRGGPLGAVPEPPREERRLAGDTPFGLSSREDAEDGGSWFCAIESDSRAEAPS